MTSKSKQYYFRFRIFWYRCFQKVKVYQQTKFRWHISIDGWDITTTVFQKQTSAVLEIYFRFRFRPFARNLHIILHQRIQFKIAISAFDCVREHYPACFNNVCIPVAGISGRANPRSAENHDMFVPSTHLRSSSISRGQFRAGLKTHLFTQAYANTSENFCWRVSEYSLSFTFTSAL